MRTLSEKEWLATLKLPGRAFATPEDERRFPNLIFKSPSGKAYIWKPQGKPKALPPPPAEPAPSLSSQRGIAQFYGLTLSQVFRLKAHFGTYAKVLSGLPFDPGEGKVLALTILGDMP